jgi:hypothetical protein
MAARQPGVCVSHLNSVIRLLEFPTGRRSCAQAGVREDDLRVARARRRSGGDVHPTTGEPVPETTVLPLATPEE